MRGPAPAISWSKSGHATSARYHGEKALGNHWVVIRYDEETTSSNSRPYHVAQYFSYDAKAGHFVDVMFDNSGESYGAGSSSGWQGDAITFENTDFTSGSHSLFRDVFTRHGATVISHTGYQRDKSGKWVKIDQKSRERMLGRCARAHLHQGHRYLPGRSPSQYRHVARADEHRYFACGGPSS